MRDEATTEALCGGTERAEGEDFSSGPMLEHTLLVPPEFLMLVWRGPENLPLEQT